MARLNTTATPRLCRASHPLCRVPITPQAIDFSGLVMGAMGVTGSRAHVWACTQARMQAGARSRGRVHPITPVAPITK